MDQNGAAPSTDLFTYNATTGAALTLAVNPLTPDQIAAALPGAPGGNGNALSPSEACKTRKPPMDTPSPSYMATWAASRQRSLDCPVRTTTKTELAQPSRVLRQQISGVYLDEEAENMMEYQRSYQAIPKMLGTLNSVTDTLMNMVGVVTTMISSLDASLTSFLTGIDQIQQNMD